MKTAELVGGREAVFGCHIHEGTSMLDQKRQIYCSIWHQFLETRKLEDNKDLDFLYILNMFLFFSWNNQQGSISL